MILLVDDDPTVLTSLGLLLKQAGYRTRSASTPAAALVAAADPELRLVLQDMNFSRSTSGEEGLELVRELRRRHPRLPVILITAWGSIGLAVEGMKAGAADFLTKPWSHERVLQAVATALRLAEDDGGEEVADRAELDRRGDFTALIGQDPAFVRLLALVARVAATDASVLITGESGTGKELVAEALHRNSERAGGPFVKVNLGGVSSTLFESEMFGHLRGAFTDAHQRRQGRFEVADGGTIFLDELGELDLASQVKLLRVLQDRTFEVLGSSASRQVDVRVISATNRDLAAQVAEGTFREDLLYRLNLIAVHLPPLRERRGDVAPLARHFLADAAHRYRRPTPALTAEGTAWLRGRPWPGNVRQLRQVIERAVLVTDGPTLDAPALEALAGLDSPGAESRRLPLPGAMTLEQMERGMIEECLHHYGGNLTQIAEALGLSRQALSRRLDKYGLQAERG